MSYLQCSEVHNESMKQEEFRTVIRLEEVRFQSRVKESLSKTDFSNIYKAVVNSRRINVQLWMNAGQTKDVY